MKFVGLRKYAGKTAEQLQKYVTQEVGRALTDLFVGLRHLKFADNFDHFFQDVTLGSTASESFANKLNTTAVIWFPVRITGESRVVETSVTADTITLQNKSTTTTTATILVMRR